MKIDFNMRFRKEIQIFKEVYQHSLFGDHVQEVRIAPSNGRVQPHHVSSSNMHGLHVPALP